MKINVETIVNSPIELVWKVWTSPEDIKQWNAASEEWHTTSSSVDLRVGGRFSSRMEAKDGSIGFDFAGVYTKVVENQLIEYELEDRRLVLIEFSAEGNNTKVTETFDAETANDPEFQKQGWQAILDNFKAYVEDTY